MSQISTGCLNPNQNFIAVVVVPVVFLNSCPPACFLTISLSVKSGIEENSRQLFLVNLSFIVSRGVFSQTVVLTCVAVTNCSLTLWSCFFVKEASCIIVS